MQNFQNRGNDLSENLARRINDEGRSSTGFPLWKRSQSIRKVGELGRREGYTIKVSRSACKRARRRVSALDSRQQLESIADSIASCSHLTTPSIQTTMVHHRLICIIARGIHSRFRVRRSIKIHRDGELSE